ncbi:MAG: hypothetical protein IT223_10410, partial [Crocinitomicaceae bacterium]|nr:hypothetical protein [Crocinitomicaceae bacterium]
MPKSSGLIGIDIAYLIALFGTMAGNCIFVLGGKGPYLTQMHFFLVFDIFPALFFFLNGMTVTLTMRDKKVSNRKLLAYLGKRGAVFFIVGLIFCT